MSSNENLYLSVEISSTETNTDYESYYTSGDLTNSSDDTRINIEVEDKSTNEEENETVEGESHIVDDEVNQDRNQNAETIPKGPKC